jgi:hypothetical protein
MFIKHFLDYRGHHWKGITLYNANEASLQKNVFFMSENALLNTVESFKP